MGRNPKKKNSRSSALNPTLAQVTIWDAGAGGIGKQAAFMGECILNLSKLVPFQGHIIEQDFDVKQGRQYKPEVNPNSRKDVPWMTKRG